MPLSSGYKKGGGDDFRVISAADSKPHNSFSSSSSIAGFLQGKDELNKKCLGVVESSNSSSPQSYSHVVPIYTEPSQSHVENGRLNGEETPSQMQCPTKSTNINTKKHESIAAYLTRQNDIALLDQKIENKYLLNQKTMSDTTITLVHANKIENSLGCFGCKRFKIDPNCGIPLFCMESPHVSHPSHDFFVFPSVCSWTCAAYLLLKKGYFPEWKGGDIIPEFLDISNSINLLISMHNHACEDDQHVKFTRLDILDSFLVTPRHLHKCKVSFHNNQNMHLFLVGRNTVIDPLMGCAI